MHHRTLVRNTIRDVLIAANTAAGSRVYTNRVTSGREIEKPLISIYVLEESVDVDSSVTSPRELKRTIPLMIECHLEGDEVDNVPTDSSISDALDDIAEQIETAMHADPYFHIAGEPVVSESVLQGTEISFDPSGAKILGMIILTYEIMYQTLAPEAPTNLDDFTTADVTYNLNGNTAPADQVDDLFEVQ